MDTLVSLGANVAFFYSLAVQLVARPAPALSAHMRRIFRAVFPDALRADAGENERRKLSVGAMARALSTVVAVHMRLGENRLGRKEYKPRTYARVVEHLRALHGGFTHAWVSSDHGAEAVAALLAEAGWGECDLLPDLNNVLRMVIASPSNP